MSDATHIAAYSHPPVPEATLVTSFRPSTAGQRLVNVDFVRGVALLGILFVNAIVLFGPVAALSDPGLQVRQPADRIVALLILSLCQGKFISLFSLLFGYGLLGQIEKAAATGQSPAWFTFRRMAALAVFGLVHGLAIWFGDILLLYACLGGWLLLARGARARTLLIVAGCLLAFAVGLRIGLEAINAVALEFMPPAPASTETYRGIEAMRRAMLNPASPVWINAEIAAYRDGPWLDAQLFRSVEWLLNTISLFFLGWMSLGMFFLGGALYRVRFFAAEQRPLRWRVLSICLPAGLVIEGLAACFFWSWPASNRWAWLAGNSLQQVGLFFLPLGYLAGLALLADRLPRLLRGPVASAGRMSLTVYLLESVLATALSYHWGLGWFGQVGAGEQALIALCLWAGLVAFSHAWLSLFAQGPMEWLWRRLAYGRGAGRQAAS